MRKKMNSNVIKCSHKGCDQTANINSREVDGWTVMPRGSELCPTHNAIPGQTFMEMPSEERGKIIRMVVVPK